MKQRHYLHLLVSLLVIGLLLTRLELRELGAAFGRVNGRLLALAAALLFGGMVMRMVRWYLIANKDQKRVHFGDACEITFIGAALGVVAPASTGEVAKSYYAYRKRGHKEGMLGSSVVDKLVAMLAAFLLGLVSAAWLRLWGYVAVEAVLTGLFGLVVFCPRALPWGVLTRLAGRLRITLDADKLCQAASLPFRLRAGMILWSLAAWVVTFAACFVVFLSLGAEVLFLEVVGAWPLITAAKFVPWTLDGIGAQEAAAAYLMQRFGVQAEITVAAQLLSRFLGSYVPALIGALLIARRQRLNLPSADLQAEE